MAKMNQMQKCTIANQILAQFNNNNFDGGEKITIEIETKRNGDLKNLTITKGETEQ